jgi:hypothetical protein
LEGNIRLAGRIPTEFGQFTDLEFFSISNTTIRARIPREYQALTKLTDLRMANTLVGGSIPDEISVLTDLFNADLADSRFRQTIPTILGNFRNMSECFTAVIFRTKDVSNFPTLTPSAAYNS